MSEPLQPTSLAAENPFVPRFMLAILAMAIVFPIHLLLFSSENDQFYLYYALSLGGLLILAAYILRNSGGWAFAAFFIATMSLQNVYLGFLLNYEQNPEMIPTLVLIETKTVLLFGGFGFLLLLSWSTLWTRRGWDLGS